MVTLGSKNIEIVDNFLPDKLFDEVKDHFLGTTPDWYYNPRMTAAPDEWQMVHEIFSNHKVMNDQSFTYIEKIAQYMNPIPILFVKMKANQMPTTKEHYLPNYHVDFPNCITSIFYLTTTNGKTIFETGVECECIANRLVTFDSNLYHTGYTSTDKRRVLLNINYMPLCDIDIKKAKNEYNTNNEWTG